MSCVFYRCHGGGGVWVFSSERQECGRCVRSDEGSKYVGGEAGGELQDAGVNELRLL